MSDCTKLRSWFEAHIPEEKMIFKKPWIDAYSFWDYHILPLFSNAWNESYDLDAFHEDINQRIEVVGEHWSKSILHPVLKITYKDVIVVIRYNFYDYNIAVISPKPLTLPISTLFESREQQYMHQGFPEKYVVDGRYETNKCEFMAYVDNHYKFYTFMFLLKQEIDRVNSIS